jgi:hypothetical protein
MDANTAKLAPVENCPVFSSGMLGGSNDRLNASAETGNLIIIS